MKITFLGTGTSQGVPVVTCKCATCLSKNPKDKRLRCSILIESESTSVVIDITPDFRYQMLRSSVEKIDAIVLTHEHNDHTAGLDDVRPFNFRFKKDMQVYCHPRVEADLRLRFAYIFGHDYPGLPKIAFSTISKVNPFQIGDLPFIPIESLHGKLPVLGFRIHDFAYITDAKTMAKEELEKLKGLEVLVINALQYEEHYSHLTVQQALDIVEILQPKKVWFTHMSHRIGLHDQVNGSLPVHINLAHDGLSFSL